MHRDCAPIRRAAAPSAAAPAPMTRANRPSQTSWLKSLFSMPSVLPAELLRISRISAKPITPRISHRERDMPLMPFRPARAPYARGVSRGVACARRSQAVLEARPSPRGVLRGSCRSSRKSRHACGRSRSNSRSSCLSSRLGYRAIRWRSCTAPAEREGSPSTWCNAARDASPCRRGIVAGKHCVAGAGGLCRRQSGTRP